MILANTISCILILTTVRQGESGKPLMVAYNRFVKAVNNYDSNIPGARELILKADTPAHELCKRLPAFASSTPLQQLLCPQQTRDVKPASWCDDVSVSWVQSMRVECLFPSCYSLCGDLPGTTSCLSDCLSLPLTDDADDVDVDFEMQLESPRRSVWTMPPAAPQKKSSMVKRYKVGPYDCIDSYCEGKEGLHRHSCIMQNCQ